VGHFFAGAGGVVNGYKIVEVLTASGVKGCFETVLAVDAWATALETCRRLNGCTVHLHDLFDAEHYALFHGHPPPDDWAPMTPADLRRICPTAPDVIFASPPCKGFTQMIGTNQAKKLKYTAYNSLVFRWLFLCMEAWSDAPPKLVLMENVANMADPQRKKRKRGEHLVEQVERMLFRYGYASRRSKHNCGPLSGGAQNRWRFLLAGRHMKRCPQLLFEPFELPMTTIGDAIGDLPTPCYQSSVPMHDLPNITEATAQRLAFVRPGGDWRSIEGTWLSAGGWTLAERGDGCRLLLPTRDGQVDVQDPRVGRAYRRGVFGLLNPDGQCGTITGRTGPSNGTYSVADPQLGRTAHNNVFRLSGFDEQSPCVTAGGTPTAGGLNVGDPRLPPRASRHNAKFSVRRLDQQAGTVTGASGGDHTAQLADPRLTCRPRGAALRVLSIDAQSPTVSGTTGVWSNCGVQLADPRPNRGPRNGSFGVQPLDGQSATITGSFDVHNGPAAVADRRPHMLCSPILTMEGLWHRPFTARELADLQTFPRCGADGRPLEFAGGVTDIRMQIGNAVPPLAARSIAEQMLRTLLNADGVPLAPEGSAIWVRGDDGVLHEVLTSRRVPPPSSIIEGVVA